MMFRENTTDNKNHKTNLKRNPTKEFADKKSDTIKKRNETQV